MYNEEEVMPSKPGSLKSAAPLLVAMIIEYRYNSYTNCGNLVDPPEYKEEKGSIRLKRFAVDGIIDDQGNRGISITWE